MKYLVDLLDAIQEKVWDMNIDDLQNSEFGDKVILFHNDNQTKEDQTFTVYHDLEEDVMNDIVMDGAWLHKVWHDAGTYGVFNFKGILINLDAVYSLILKKYKDVDTAIFKIIVLLAHEYNHSWWGSHDRYPEGVLEGIQSGDYEIYKWNEDLAEDYSYKILDIIDNNFDNYRKWFEKMVKLANKAIEANYDVSEYKERHARYFSDIEKVRFDSENRLIISFREGVAI